MKDDKMMCGGKLSVCNLGVSLGIVYALSTFFLGYLAIEHRIGVPMVEMMASVFKGYNLTYMGALKGAAWGFVDGFVFGALLAWVYNFCHAKCPCKTCTKCRK